MKKLFAFLTSVMILLSVVTEGCAEVREKTDYAELFEKDSIIDIEIEIDEADLADMWEYSTNEEYHAADITVDGITVENAGIRTKGNMTLRSIAKMDSDRYSYRIKFNKYVKGQKLLGLNELCLNSGYSDASYMREYLHYEILREMGMNVPETVFCNLYINGEYAGFYLAVEAIDSSFVETEFDDPDEKGNLYKMDEGASLVYKENEDYSYADLKLGKDTGKTDLKAMIKALNEMPEGEKGDIEKYLNVESALKYIASNTVLSNYDSYNGNRNHNYYLYENEAGVFTVVPWDFNMSFGGNGGESNIGIDTPVNGGNIDNLPLIKNLLAVPEYKEMYYGYIKELMDILEDFEDRVNELKAIIKPYVEKDTTAFYTVEEFEKATSKSDGEEEAAAPSAGNNENKGGPGFGRGKSIVDCIYDRLENLTAQFAGTAEKSTSSGGGKMPGGNKPGGDRPDGDMPGDLGGLRGDRQWGGRENTAMPQMPEGLMPPEGFENGGNNQGLERPQDKGHGGFERQENNNSAIRVNINGHIIAFEENPVLNDGTTLVGYRSVMEALGAEVTWDDSTKTVTAVKGDTSIVLMIGSDTAYVNGEEKDLLKAPEIIGSSTMIPIRFISEELGMKVEWHENSGLIEITSKK